MSNGQLVAEERRRRMAQRLRQAGSVSVSALEVEFGISAITVRRDLSALEAQGRAVRTHGGAVLPTLARHEDSFQYRLKQDQEEKETLARAAAVMLEEDEAVFVDSSTTSYYTVRRMVEISLKATVLTNLVPSMELMGSMDSPNLELIGVGGSLRKLTLSFVGPQAIRTIESYYAEKCVLSVKGVTPDGYLTDPDPLETEVKRAMISRSESPLLLIDGHKLEQRGLNVVGHVTDVERVIVANGERERIERLEELGASVYEV